MSRKQEVTDHKQRRPAVVASLQYYTGGPEALHQLDHALRLAGIDSHIGYFGDRDEVVRRDFARRYDSREAENAVNPEAILIIPEIENPQQWRQRGWKRIIVWWLAAPRFHPLADYQGCFHIFQSRYAAEQRAAEGISGTLVTDYLRAEYFNQSPAVRSFDERSHVITCNRRSAAWLANAAPELSGVTIEVIDGFTPERVTKILRSARYFLDVGWHPGRDRMPREAAMLGCVVLCGRQGSAAFNEDMPLAEELRIDDQEPGSLAARISYCEQNPDIVTAAMDRYRAWIARQEITFQAEVAQLIDNPAGPWHRDSAVSITPPDHDPVPELNHELNLARNQLAQVGVQALRLGQGKTLSGILYRLEKRLRRWRQR